MSEIEYAYEGLVVSSIKADPKVGEDGQPVGNQVLFSDSNDAGEKARFLKCVIDLGGGNYEATEVVTAAEAKDLVTNPHQRVGESDEDYAKRFEARQSATPLFCVHGFNNEPDVVLRNTKAAAPIFDEKGGQHYPIPILWPSDVSLTDPFGFYEDDQEKHSQDAGKLLKTFVDNISNDIFPRKSLMMHSMGNHVVFNGACGQGAPDVKFENIFFVAADVPYDIFHKNPDSNYFSDGQQRVYGRKYEKATNFFTMLARKPNGQPKGKIYFLHHLNDLALWTSSNVMNWECRVGQRGIGKYKWVWNQSWYEDTDLVRDEIRNGYYQNYDVSGQSMSDLVLTTLKHSYQFESWAIKFYNEKSENISQS